MTRLAGPRIPVIGLAALLLSQAAMAAEDLPVSRAQAEPLPVIESSPSLRGPQFVQADKQGRVFVLEGDTLEIFQIVAGDKLASRGKLEATGSVETGERALLRQAVMSPAGDVWLLLESTGKVRLFRGGKEKSLPPTDWIVTALAELVRPARRRRSQSSSLIRLPIPPERSPAGPGIFEPAFPSSAPAPLHSAG
jgi:hypothetical protein